MRCVPLLVCLSLLACRGGTEVEHVDADGDGFTDDADCNDGDASAFPDNPETCDGVDNDCDGVIDDDPTDASTFYADVDGDGFGDATATEAACDQPTGFVTDDTDCDDNDADFHPGAVEDDCTDPADYNCDGSVGWADDDGDGFPACQDCDDGASAVNPDASEVCDGIDNDCDAAADELGALDESTWYADADGDGYGNPTDARRACDAPDGYVGNATDCNDSSADAHPGGVETCDGVDNDCNGSIDGPDASGATTWYVDGDGDGHGHTTGGVKACEAPSGFVDSRDDCDDTDAASHPGGTETCDDADNDCNGVVDDDFDKTWYLDADGDGYGRSGIELEDCDRPSGFTGVAGDCDDVDALAYPGADERCNGADDDCDGAPDADEADGDGDDYRICDGDCEDGDATVFPGADDTWYDGVDQDCDGASDYDQDGDGHDTVASGGDDRNDLDPACSDDCSDGLSKPSAGDSCQQILDDYDAASGEYWVDLDADGDTSNAVQVWCEMTSDGEGWTYIVYEGLVAYFGFDDDDPWEAEWGSFGGSFVGGAGVSSAVPFDGFYRSAAFNNQDYQRLDLARQVPYGPESTTLYWVRNTSCSNNQIPLMMADNSNRIGDHHHVASVVAGGSQRFFTNSNGCENVQNTWRQHAYVDTGSAWRVFVNGSAVSSDSAYSYASMDGASLKWIGSRPGFGTNGLGGEIDDIAIFDRALSPAEINALRDQAVEYGRPFRWQ